MKQLINRIPPWALRVSYLTGAAIILGAETIAIINIFTEDTITENVRNVIFVHPVVWAVTLGATVGLLGWMTRHFWWRKE